MVSPVMFENGVDGARINISDPDQWEITFDKDNKVGYSHNSSIYWECNN